MSNSADTKFSSNLSQLYLGRLRERKAAFEIILARLKRNSVRLEDFDTIERECHKLGGTGATYGFPEISNAALPITNKLRSGAYQTADIAQLLTTLLQVMDNSMVEAPPESDMEWKPELPLPLPMATGYRPMILIADDDPGMRDLLFELLIKFAAVQFASTGKEVLDAVRTKRFDVILLDNQLPDIDGHQVLTSMRSIVEAARTSVMMITASGDAKRVAQLLRAGARDYIVKPFSPQNLVRRVTASLRQRPPIVLLADDDPLIRTIVSAKLQQRGVNVVLASNGAEALALARQIRPHAIILDRAMPRMDGLDVLLEIRRDGSICSTPVVVLSARKTDVDISEGMKCGADDYVPKPFLPDDVVSRCMSLLGAPPPDNMAA